MGLGIWAFSHIQPVCGEFEFENEQEIRDRRTQKLLPHLIGFRIDPKYKDWAAGIEPGQAYSYLSQENFHIGSYSYIAPFRDWLSRLVENGLTDEPGDPFYELICFSDCQGTINAKISAKLHQDFVQFHAKAKTFSEAVYHILAYESFMRAFQIASLSGAVSFN